MENRHRYFSITIFVTIPNYCDFYIYLEFFPFFFLSFLCFSSFNVVFIVSFYFFNFISRIGQ